MRPVVVRIEAVEGQLEPNTTARRAQRRAPSPRRSAVKLPNSYLSCTALIVTSEAVVLGRQASLDTETICEIFSVSRGRSSATEDNSLDAIAEGHGVDIYDYVGEVTTDAGDASPSGG